MNRLLELQEALERGEPVDLRRLARLQALDAAIAGRTRVDELVEEEKQRDAEHQQFLGDLIADI